MEFLVKHIPEKRLCYVFPTITCGIVWSIGQLVYLNVWSSGPSKILICSTWIVLICLISLVSRILYDLICSLFKIRGILHDNIYYGISSCEGRGGWVDPSRSKSKRLNYVDELNYAILGATPGESYDEERDLIKLKKEFFKKGVSTEGESYVQEIEFKKRFLKKAASGRVMPVLSYSTWLRYYPQQIYNPQNSPGSCCNILK